MSKLAVGNASGANGANNPDHANGRTCSRWRLNRAGIINVYQYENEVLDFAGGRLLLRGVNGSGKSTAMNMLLPFLLTARPGRIDAAGEQTGILKSWMLDGRDDAQPVGYLWIEFERRGEFLVCGCGIKASRQSASVSTWWFVTSKRPGLDVHLVVGDQPLSAEGLRAALDGDEVYGDRRRSDYRHAVQQRIFGGVSIDQHIGLIHVVRSPRVGDRIDIELPEHLVEALPQLSEQALAEAAQPLDDLEEHRRNVADLERTSEAISGLLDVYRAYCADELRRHAAEGRSRLSAERDRARDDRRRQQAAGTAEAEVVRLDEAIAEQERTADRLRSEISALEESRAYREGRQLDALRDFVANLARRRENAAARVAGRKERLEAATGELLRARERGRNDAAALNVGVAAAAELSEHCRVGRRPPGPIVLAETALAGAEASEPGAVFDNSVILREIDATSGAVLARRADVDQVGEARAALHAAENELSLVGSRFEDASGAADRCSGRLAEQDQRLAAARRQWHDSARLWASEADPAFRSAGLDTPASSVLAAAGPDIGVRAGDGSQAKGAAPDTASGRVEIPDAAEPLSAVAGAAPDAGSGSVETVRIELSSACDELIGHWRQTVAAVEFRLGGEQAAASDAQVRVDALADRTEPEPPRLGWQTEAEYCLADLIDFKAHLGEAERSGVEAALESSGLLSARLLEGGTLELSTGELVAAAARPVASPLSDCLEVTIPDQLDNRVDADSVARLLESISSDPSSDTATVVATDGSFRLGALHGRHSKDQPEFVGATARRRALERERQEASALLESAVGVVRDSEAELARHRSSLQQARRLRERLPSDAAILQAAADVAAAADAADVATANRDSAAADRDKAERAAAGASNELQRVAVTLHLPQDHAGLGAVRGELHDLAAGLDRCRSLLEALTRSMDDWRGAAVRWQEAHDDLRAERADLSGIESEHNRERARLVTIEDSIGAEYAEVVATRDRCREALEQSVARLPEVRKQQRDAVDTRAEAQAAARLAGRERARAAEACEETWSTLVEVLSTPGLLDALSALDDTPPAPIVTETAGPKGLHEVLDAVDRLLNGIGDDATSEIDGTTGDASEAPGSELGTDRDRPVGRVRSTAGSDGTSRITADSVRQSLRRRRDALGSGWDAEGRQPDPGLPLVVEVTGPSGRAPLADSARAVSQQRDQMAALLDHKQSEALRELLQGLIARELAQRVHGAARLVERMNERLDAVKTAHDVGVRLRWRRSGELDPATNTMIDLLTKLPDLRTPDDESNLRRALSDHLQEARILQPDVPYRQLISEALDYKQWHDMAEMVHRPGGNEARLSRHTPLSEGEKKLVTYLPLFAAVAASCDSMAEQAGASSDNGHGVARFVVLDDAFAKVSEDNHAKLFGLLVELDLDLIATSERLWGTHATVPELAVTEVVRDARLGAILLEHYRWDGATLERRPAA
ncbi:MAG: TIGR02680 family protein [Acidimicrobiaceae bacterium]|nr:TIGR02680 family protein [Acidimicrobiaceae bacterium]